MRYQKPLWRFYVELIGYQNAIIKNIYNLYIRNSFVFIVILKKIFEAELITLKCHLNVTNLNYVSYNFKSLVQTKSYFSFPIVRKKKKHLKLNNWFIDSYTFLYQSTFFLSYLNDTKTNLYVFLLPFEVFDFFALFQLKSQIVDSPECS